MDNMGRLLTVMGAYLCCLAVGGTDFRRDGRPLANPACVDGMASTKEELRLRGLKCDREKLPDDQLGGQGA